ncbi:Stf0 family sulfotransferase [Kordiimonas sp.]|uniref:Stf0 family sulfotransferase n=1 Tax=Kordiimonas sp. TaxID=1970157 RepID=UPI003A8E1244
MELKQHQHETDILAYYDGDRARTQITGKLPGKGVFVLFGNRSGSNYLVDLMKRIPDLSMRHEIFNSVNVQKMSDQHGLHGFEDYVRFMRRDCKTSHWGAKIGCIQLDMLHRFGLLDAFEQGSHIIWIKRKNIIAQAVSHFIAHHNQQWASFHEAKGEMPDYDFDAIERIVASCIKHNSDVELSLAVLNQRYHTVWYEDLIDRPLFTIRRIAVFIDEPFEKLGKRKSMFEKQVHSAKDEFEARFREEARRRMGLELS